MVSSKDSSVKPERQKYPRLVEYEDGTVVLLTAETWGTVVFHAVTAHKLGDYLGGWSTDYHDFTGSITLSNE